jgi:hypothetical protein
VDKCITAFFTIASAHCLYFIHKKSLAIYGKASQPFNCFNSKWTSLCALRKLLRAWHSLARAARYPDTQNSSTTSKLFASFAMHFALPRRRRWICISASFTNSSWRLHRNDLQDSYDYLSKLSLK